MGGVLVERDRVEAFADVAEAANDLQVHLALDVVLDGGGCGEGAGAGAAEPEHEGAVVELAGDDGVDALGVEPEVEGPADLRVVGGEEHGLAVERFREAAAEAFCAGGGGEKGDAGLGEEVVVAAELDGGSDGGVAEDDVGAVGGEVGEESVGLVFAADEAHGLGEGRGGGEELARDGLRDDVEDADAEAQGGSGGLAFQGVEQFLTEGEHLVGVVEGDATGLGEAEPAADAVEEAVAEGGLEVSKLVADRGLGDHELLGGADDSALAGDDPEVVEVVVIEPLHRARLYIQKSNGCGRNFVFYLCLSQSYYLVRGAGSDASRDTFACPARAPSC